MMAHLVPILGLSAAGGWSVWRFWLGEIFRAKRRSSLPPRAAVILYSYYPEDPRPRREAEALVEAGWEVDILCLRRSRQSLDGVTAGLTVFRLPLKRRRNGFITYLVQYTLFFVASFFFLATRGAVRRYQLVHVHNMPDFLVFSALVPRVLGAKVVLDLHDPTPEVFQSIYSLKESSLLVRFLKRMEALSIRFADLVLTPNFAFRELFSRRCSPAKLRIVMNSPDERLFSIQSASQRNGHHGYQLIYHGSVLERSGLCLAVQALGLLQEQAPEIKLNIYGEPTPYLDRVMDVVHDLGLEPRVEYGGFKSLEEVPQAILSADLGLIPNLPNVFNQLNLPTRIFECLAVGKPVIVPRTKGIQDYFEEDELIYFEPGSVSDLASKIHWAHTHPAEVQVMVERGQVVYRRHLWNSEKREYLSLIAELAKPAVVICPSPR